MRKNTASYTALFLILFYLIYYFLFDLQQPALILETELQENDHYKNKLTTKQTQFDTVTTLIKSALDEDELQWFRDTQFGPLLDVPTHNEHAAQSLWSLMLIMTTEQRDAGELWFLVNNVPLRYGIREFSIITGMLCHQVPRLPQNEEKSRAFYNDFKNRLWPSLKKKQRITVKKIQERLASIHEEPLGSDDKNRLACLGIVFGVICFKDRPTQMLDDELIAIVGDIDFFLGYPWGDSVLRVLNEAASS